MEEVQLLQATNFMAPKGEGWLKSMVQFVAECTVGAIVTPEAVMTMRGKRNIIVSYKWLKRR